MNLPAGFQLEDTPPVNSGSGGMNLPPGFQLEQPQQQPAAQPPMTMRGLGQNAISDVKDIGSSIPGALGQMATLPKKLLFDMPNDIYQSGKQMYQGKPFLQTPVGQQAGQFGSMVKALPENILHPYDHPVKAALDAATLADMGAKAYDAARPILAPLGRTVADVAEKGSGLTYKTPGVLEETFAEPKKLFAPGLDKARELYGENDQSVRPELNSLPNHQDFVEKALELAKNGDLKPAEALEARKSLDRIKKNVTGSYYRTNRQTLDTIAKQQFAIPDQTYSQAIKSENMRSLFPLNKTGTPSIFKTVLGGVQTAAIPLLSPMVQGATAAGLGAMDKMAVGASRSRLLSGLSLSNVAVNKGGNQLNNGFSDNQENQTSNTPIENDNHNSPKRVITENKAREYLKKANGNKPQARAMAIADGWALA